MNWQLLVPPTCCSRAACILPLAWLANLQNPCQVRVENRRGKQNTSFQSFFAFFLCVGVPTPSLQGLPLLISSRPFFSGLWEFEWDWRAQEAHRAVPNKALYSGLKILSKSPRRICKPRSLLWALSCAVFPSMAHWGLQIVSRWTLSIKVKLVPGTSF